MNSLQRLNIYIIYICVEGNVGFTTLHFGARILTEHRPIISLLGSFIFKKIPSFSITFLYWAETFPIKLAPLFFREDERVAFPKLVEAWGSAHSRGHRRRG